MRSRRDGGPFVNPVPPHGGPQIVLVIDDSEDIHDLIDVRLRSEDVRILHALDATSGVALAKKQPPDLFLLDLDLGDEDGLAVCRNLRDDAVLSSVPVIILTGTTDVATKAAALDSGAVDYVTKPFDAVELRARVRVALRTKRYHDLLTTRAQLDAVTGQWNRANFDARLAETSGRITALLLVDLDHFRRLNDTFGRPVGDRVLRGAAQAISAQLRPADALFRYGPDEFAILLPDTDITEATLLAESVRAAIAATGLAHASSTVDVTASIGIAASKSLIESERASPEALLATADRGIYLARRRGGNRTARGDTASNEALDETMVTDIVKGLRRPRFIDPGARFGPYQILETVGDGGMGTVYRALDERLLREVALKVLHSTVLETQEGWRRFSEEARALAALDHPNMVRVFDIGVAEDGTPYLVLEFLEGTTLRDRIDAGPMPLPEALELMCVLVPALAVAHDKGIIHRDLKPENIFITRTGTLKVLDFGLAKRMRHPAMDPDLPPVTNAGQLLGTLGYLSPEQACGVEVDARSDLFSVGIILHELVTGHRPFARATPLETLQAILEDDPPKAKPPELDALLRRCLAKKPVERVASAQELLALLLALRATGLLTEGDDAAENKPREAI